MASFPVNKTLSVELARSDIAKPIKIWLDGAFDMMHYGHMNAFRQGRALGTYLIVGVNSDESITACKGKPITCEEERVATVLGCKWVDEVVRDVPYVMNDAYLQHIIETYQLDYIVHGDDPCIVDGKDVYESAQKVGKYRTIPRTEGISTTDIVGRILDHFQHINNDDNHNDDNHNNDIMKTAVQLSASSSLPITTTSTTQVSPALSISPRCLTSIPRSLTHTKSNFLVTNTMMRLFSENPHDNNCLEKEHHQSVDASSTPPVITGAIATSSTSKTTTTTTGGGGIIAIKETKRKVVYIAGSWDMFHAGHLQVLAEAKSLGDYLIVGIYNDTVACHLFQHEQELLRQQGSNDVVPCCSLGSSLSDCGHFPIMTMGERTLSVLGCSYADDILHDAPYMISSDMMSALHIDIVAEVPALTPQFSESSGELSTREEMIQNAPSQISQSHMTAPSQTSQSNLTGAYEVPIREGKHRWLSLPSSPLSSSHMIRRIAQDQSALTDKIKRKKKAEEQYYADRYGHSPSASASQI